MDHITTSESYRITTSDTGISSSRIYLQLAIYLFGFILLISLQIGFSYLIKDLNNSVVNEYARLKIGDVIISDIRHIETNIYKLVISKGKKRQNLINKQINKKINDLNGALEVLSNGGEVIRLKNLNLIDQENVKEVISYIPGQTENQYILEIIELRPKIKQIHQVIDKIIVLITKRDSILLSNDKEQHLLLSNQIKQTIQTISPIIDRMIENANRLFFEGQKKLKVIEASINKRENFYIILQFSFSILIIIAVLFIGFFILRQVQNSNKKLNKLAEELNFQIFALDQHAIVSSTDVAGVITYVNDRFCDISGYTKKELVGNNHRIIKSDEHSPELFKTMWKTISSGKVWQGEVKNSKKDGGFYWVAASIVPFLNEKGKPFKYISIRTDITKRKAMEDQINVSHRFLQSLTDAMGEGVYALDSKGDCTFINPETEKITGWSKKELMGQNIHNYIHFQTHDGQHLGSEDCPTYKSIRKGKNYYSDDEYFTHKNGTLFPVSIKSVPLYENDKIIGSVAIFHDISQRKNNEKELMNAKVQAELANQEKSNFLANMSHEIRTPMNAIIGMSYLALQTELNSAQENYINKIHLSAESLLRIINDILDFSKIEAGKMDIESINFELHTILENIEIMFEEKIKKKPIELKVIIDSDVPEYFIGDPLRLSQILINLCNNAIKFTEQGAVTINVRVDDLMASEHIKLHFSVQDTGIGISKKQQEILFQSFSQADSSTTRKYGGTGLGLSIAKEITHLLKGDIWVESQPDIGSIFHFTVQLKKTTNKIENQTSNTSKNYLNSIKKLTGATILLVEDNLLNQELATDLLKKNNIKVIQANNGEDALQLLRQHNVDGILMDIQMPVMNGYEATQIIREDKKYTDLPIIAMTASTMAGDNEKIIKAGLNDFIPKPINIRHMFITMAKWIQSSAKYHEQPELIFNSENEKQSFRAASGDDIYIDHKNTLSRIGNDNEIYVQILKTFLDDHLNNLGEISNALKNSQYEEARRIAHTLKGVSGNIGATKLQQLMTALETCIMTINNNSKISLCEPLFEQANTVLKKTEKSINDYISNRNRDNSTTHSISTQVAFNETIFLSELSELHNLLKSYDSNSSQFLNTILAQGYGADCKETMIELKDLIEQYDYETADQLLTHFLNEFNNN